MLTAASTLVNFLLLSFCLVFGNSFPTRARTRTPARLWAPGRTRHLPRETFLPLLQVSIQHCLQLLLQNAEGLPGGQAQGQGRLALEGRGDGSRHPTGGPGPLPSRLPRTFLPPPKASPSLSFTSPWQAVGVMSVFPTELKDVQVHSPPLFKAQFNTKLEGLPWRSSVGHHARKADGTGLTPGRGTKIPQTTQHSQKIKQNQKQAFLGSASSNSPFTQLPAHCHQQPSTAWAMLTAQLPLLHWGHLSWFSGRKMWIV